MAAKPADIGSKRLISLAPDAWVQWLLDDPEAHTTDMLSADFQWVGKEIDALLRVQSPTSGEFLVLNEVQLHYRPDMPLLAFFASFVLDTKLIRSIMRWDMAVLRESPWYYEIHKEGFEEGIEQGSNETALRNLTSLLQYRFGPLPATITSTLAALRAARLQALFDVALKVETLAEFQANLLSNGVVASNGQTA